LSEGLEWTTKISQYELPYLWDKVTGTFETYWQDDEFQRYDEQSEFRLRDAIQRERQASSSAAPAIHFDLRPFPFQEEILDLIAAEREVQNKHRHLVVAATGTGKRYAFTRIIALEATDVGLPLLQSLHGKIQVPYGGRAMRTNVVPMPNDILCRCS
jgi:hypothetical protein